MDACTDSLRALRHGFEINQADFALALHLQHPHQVGILHGRKGVVLHARFVQQHIPHKQMALEYSAAVVGKSRCGNGEISTQGGHQGLSHRANVALRRAVEGRAVFEIDLFGTCRLQPMQCCQRLRDRVCRGIGSAFQRHHHRVNVIDIIEERCLWHTNHLHHPHA